MTPPTRRNSKSQPNTQMGIRHLNRIIATKCNHDAVKKTHLSEFAGKKIAIDASIYLYRFIGENRLIEHFYLLISLFRHYDIIPLFVFDGSAPLEKQAIIQERRENKIRAEEKYKDIEKQLAFIEDRDEKHELETEMIKLKKEFIRVKDRDILKIKALLTYYGVSYVNAPGEADVLCAQLIHTNRIYACLSEDMDLFAYGCGRVLRNISLMKHTVLLYDLRTILHQLHMTMDEFRQVIVLSGTDYNKDNKTNLKQSMHLFYEYKHTEVPTFYEWLRLNTNYINDYDALKNAYEMFDVAKNINGEFIATLAIENRSKNEKELVKLLEDDGFIFIN